MTRTLEELDAAVEALESQVVQLRDAGLALRDRVDRLEFEGLLLRDRVQKAEEDLERARAVLVRELRRNDLRWWRVWWKRSGGVHERREGRGW